MKKVLMLTTIAIPFFASTSMAQEFSPYVSIKAGAGYTQTDVKRGDLKDVVPVVGAAVGVELPYNFRTEFEYTYRFEGEDKVKHAKSTTSAHVFMLNGYYDFKNKSQLTPFVGLGVGGAYWEADSKHAGTKYYDDDGFAFAASAMGGVSFAINKQIAMDFTAKYTYIDAAEGAHNIDGLLGLRFSF